MQRVKEGSSGSRQQPEPRKQVSGSRKILGPLEEDLDYAGLVVFFFFNPEVIPIQDLKKKLHFPMCPRKLKAINL